MADLDGPEDESLSQASEPSLVPLDGADVLPDYTDSWPVVEVTIAVNEILDFDIKGLTYEADFSIYLDWLDPKLRRSEHYEYNAEKARFELMRALRSCEDSMNFFNPTIFIENSKAEPEPESELPSVFDEVMCDGRDIPWLTKKYNFLGTLTCRNANAASFPLDLQGLEVRVASHVMEGVTSLGQPRRINLREPIVRRDYRQKLANAKGKRASINSLGSTGPALRFCTQGRTGDAWAVAKPTEHIMSHMWKLNDDDGVALGFGEMRVLAVGGVEEGNGQTYTLHIVLRRQWYPRYVFDFIIQNLQVFAALFGSVYVPFTSDMLTNRMSIALTVLLTLVSSTSTRPSLIESVPYSTLHDVYGRIMVFSVCMICIGNWFVFVNCWGMYREAGVDDMWNDDLNMVVSSMQPMFSESLCEKGTCGASRLDCIILYVELAAQVCVCLGLLIEAQMSRITTLLHIKHQVDAPDLNPGQYSRLVLCENSQFQFTPRSGLDNYAGSCALLPFVATFMQVWGCFRRVRRALIKTFRLWQEADVFHATEAEALLSEATDLIQSWNQKLPTIARFHLKLSPFDPFRLLDVGSGEMGFYEYRLDRLSRSIRSSGSENKLKYNKNSTFVDQFLQDTNGPYLLAMQIIQRFQLTRSSRASPPPVAVLSKDLEVPFLPSAVHAFDAESQSPTTRCSTPSFVPVHGGAPNATTSPASPAKPSSPQPGSRATSPVLGSCKSRDSCSPVTAKDRSTVVATANAKRNRKTKLLLCLTGANRQMLSEDVEGRALLQQFLAELNEHLGEYGAAGEPQGIECVPFSPQDIDEALYELWACEWVVQHGNLDVTSIRLQRHYKTLQNGKEDALTTLEEVNREFADLHSPVQLQNAFYRALCPNRPNELVEKIRGLWADGEQSFYGGAPIEITDRGWRPLRVDHRPEEKNAEYGWRFEPGVMDACIFLQHTPSGPRLELEIRLNPNDTLQVSDKATQQRWCLRRSDNDHSGPVKSHSSLEVLAPPAPKLMRGGSGSSRTFQKEVPPSVMCRSFYREFNANPHLLRALLRARWFMGTMSAGSGSSQVTLRNAASLEASKMFSIPLGNRTPMTAMKLTTDHDATTILSKATPGTRELALQMLCDREQDRAPSKIRVSHHGSDGSKCNETRPAWDEDGCVTQSQLEMWKKLVRCCAEERGLPTEQRGLFVGITAVFYAAKVAGCSDQILPRDKFLQCLQSKKDELLMEGGENSRALANLTLVMTMVEYTLHHTAFIVCKRNWSLGPDATKDAPQVVATWSLGLYLKHSGVMGVPLFADKSLDS